MTNSTNTNNPAPTQARSLKIKWILITIGICLLCILFTYLLKPTYVANASKLALKTDKSIDKAILLLENETRNDVRFLSALSKQRKGKSIVLEAAEAVIGKIEKLKLKINTLKILVCEESGGIYSTSELKPKWEGMGYRKILMTKDQKLSGRAVGIKNRSASKKVFITNGESKKLKELIISTRKEIFGILEDLRVAGENTEGIFFKFDQIQYLEKNLALQNPENEDNNSDWLTNHFKNNTVSETLLLLRKLELDCVGASFQIVRILNDGILF
jgi:hypothetical protein